VSAGLLARPASDSAASLVSQVMRPSASSPQPEPAAHGRRRRRDEGVGRVRHRRPSREPPSPARPAYVGDPDALDRHRAPCIQGVLHPLRMGTWDPGALEDLSRLGETKRRRHSPTLRTKRDGGIVDSCSFPAAARYPYRGGCRRGPHLPESAAMDKNQQADSRVTALAFPSGACQSLRLPSHSPAPPPDDQRLRSEPRRVIQSTKRREPPMTRTGPTDSPTSLTVQRRAPACRSLCD
jgi:hypothetical protein